MYNIIQNRKIWLGFSGFLVFISIVALLLWGLKLGVDFTGGSLLELEFAAERPEIGRVSEALADLSLGSLLVQPIGESSMVLRFQNTDEGIHQEVLARMNALAAPETGVDGEDAPTAAVEERRFDAVGPSIGAELKQKSISAMFIVLFAIVFYIAWAFRKVSKPVASWKYGLTAIIALFHDVIIVAGLFAVLGQFFGTEINTAFVAAILTVLGYSVNDTIVVFDRIRENLPRSEDDFETTVNASVNQTLTRSINTSFTTLAVLVSIIIFGGATIRDFVLALSAGVLIGTYSSIFLASPVLVMMEKFKMSKN